MGASGSSDVILFGMLMDERYTPVCHGGGCDISIGRRSVSLVATCRRGRRIVRFISRTA
jgi:hypothetical protein